MPKRSKPNECAQDEIEPLYEQLVTPLRRKQAGSAEGRQSAPKTPKKRQYEPKDCIPFLSSSRLGSQLVSVCKRRYAESNYVGLAAPCEWRRSREGAQKVEACRSSSVRLTVQEEGSAWGSAWSSAWAACVAVACTVVVIMTVLSRALKQRMQQVCGKKRFLVRRMLEIEIPDDERSSEDPTEDAKECHLFMQSLQSAGPAHPDSPRPVMSNDEDSAQHDPEPVLTTIDCLTSALAFSIWRSTNVGGGV